MLGGCLHSGGIELLVGYLAGGARRQAPGKYGGGGNRSTIGGNRNGFNKVHIERYVR